MKKMIVVLLSLVVVGSVPSLGTPKEDTSKVSIIKHGEVFQVIYKSLQRSIVRVTISDEEGNRLFSEKIVGDSFARPYNFSQLPKGDYILCVEDEYRSQTETLCHHEKEWVANVSKMKASKNKFLVVVPKQPNSQMQVSVFDQNDQLVYREEANGKEDFAKVYNLEGLKGGYLQVLNRLSGEARDAEVEVE
jgi:hypothetical protein